MKQTLETLLDGCKIKHPCSYLWYKKAIHKNQTGVNKKKTLLWVSDLNRNEHVSQYNSEILDNFFFKMAD